MYLYYSILHSFLFNIIYNYRTFIFALKLIYLYNSICLLSLLAGYITGMLFFYYLISRQGQAITSLHLPICAILSVLPASAFHSDLTIKTILLQKFQSFTPPGTKR